MTSFWIWSLAIHVVLGALVLVRHAPAPAPGPERVEIDFTAADELTPPALKQRRAARAKPKLERQIVEQERQVNDEIDPNTHYLSAFNQKIVQQTRAERSGKFNNEVHGGRPAAGEAKAAGAKAAAQTKVPPGELPALSDLLPKYEARPEASRDLVAGEHPPGDPTRTDDYLRDLKPGLQTMISTREFVYYAYYNRIKAALRARWEPEVRERVNVVLRQGRSLAAARDRVTQVVVTLDAGGELVGVEVISHSGVADLDEAAVTAFRQAAPFPNPPKGMLEGNGTVKIRWDFVLEV